MQNIIWIIGSGIRRIMLLTVVTMGFMLWLLTEMLKTVASTSTGKSLPLNPNAVLKWSAAVYLNGLIRIRARLGYILQMHDPELFNYFKFLF